MTDDITLTGESKADFSDIYTAPDPRRYFGTLRPLDYQIPQRAMPVVEAVLAASERGGRPRTVLDVCCSYAINATLMRFAVDLDEVGARCTDPARAAWPPEQVIADDAAFYAGRLRRDLTVLGLDASRPAIDYGLATGLLAGGWAENLEDDDPSAALADGLRDVGLVVCTGGVGYVGAPTFGRIVDAVADPADLWLAVFVLRVFDYDDIAATLDGYGLVTEQVPGVTFPQRRFADAGEAAAAVADVRARGLDPTGRESAGWFHADCFVTRPAGVAAATPLAELLGGRGIG
ncbi:class I SAM-dependent methyltransferase [Pseudonocardia sp.]|uniref:class I SAM-dependent methyltransferase n=1 Tax=Pseudonocardia sp. TaxID=60912 RepID=UPI0026260190|nr:class I SAM-dependent methyltransferase [Pseudonocardia sp.]